MTLRQRSVLAQLENDQYIDSHSDEIQQAYGRGHNTAMQAAAVSVRASAAPVIELKPENDPNLTAIERAFNRGHNAGRRHVDYVIRMHGALAELAHAPAIETVDQPLVDFNANTEADR